MYTFLKHLSLSLSACAMCAPIVLAEDLDGQLVFNNNCRTCHSMDKGDNRLGPNLFNIVGRKAGSIEGYPFSPSMKNANLTWTEDNLRKFITDPETVVPGNQMQPYGGMKSEEEKTALIEFLREQ